MPETDRYIRESAIRWSRSGYRESDRWSFRREGTLQRVRIVRSIGLIGLVVAFLLLCSAQSFEPAPRLYRAKPEDVPPSAEQGNFRFILLRGGRIDSWRPDRTWSRDN